MKKNFSKRILVSITGSKNKHWQDKLKEIENLKIKRIALFLEQFRKRQRKKIYQALLNSDIKEIPLVHIRHDIEKEELVFLKKVFKTKCFTIHESGFNHMKKWKGFYKSLYLEMNYDNFIDKKVDVNKIGGFCIDLSHFKAAEERWSKEFKYILKRRKIHKYFKCNHLNGYDYKNNKDLHTINSLTEFKYLKSLPLFVFGKYIGLETYNSIKAQLKFKEHIIKLLSS